MSNQRTQNQPAGNERMDTGESEDMAPEYDFSQGVRGKHASSMRDGYRMIIHHSDGTTEERDRNGLYPVWSVNRPAYPTHTAGRAG